MTQTDWIKASMSTGGTGCLEFRGTDEGAIEMRDSKDPTGPTLTFTKHEVQCFLDGRKKGEFVNLLENLA